MKNRVRFTLKEMRTLYAASLTSGGTDLHHHMEEAEAKKFKGEAEIKTTWQSAMDKLEAMIQKRK